MRQENIGGLLAYWNKLRGSRAAPERREIAPAAIGAWLPDTFLLQSSGWGEPRFRLAGTRICAIYGGELRTLPFASLWQSKDRNTIQRLSRNCMTSKAAAQIDGEARSARGRKVCFKLVLLPLANEANDGNLIGMMTMIGRPFWLESDVVVENHIKGVCVIDPRSERHIVGSTRAVCSNAEQAFNAASHVLVSRKVQHLRVIEGGKRTDGRNR